MRILANDGLVDEAVQLLREQGFTVDTEKRSEEDLLSELADFDALIVRSATKVRRPLVEAATKPGARLKVIGRMGVGTDNIDLDACRERGVIVKFAPHGNTNAAAEHTLGLMFAVARRVPMAHHTLKLGTWHKKRFLGNELDGKTLGVIGCGRIGQSLAEKARGIGMKVIGYDPYPVMDSHVEYRGSIDEVLAESHFVSVHTGGECCVIGERELGLMRPDAYLINASRGSNVSGEALYAALKAGRIAGAALDTYEKEPKLEGAPFESPLRELDNIVLSSHLGASTRNAARRTGMEIAQVVAAYLRRGDFVSSVNVGQTVEEEGREIYTVFITHEDKPGMFGKFGVAFGELGVNIRENNSRRLDGNVQTVYVVHQKPDETVRQHLEAIDGVFRVVV